MATLVRLVLFSAALVLIFLTSWIALPAPNRLLLTLAVAAPEVSPWLSLCGLLLCTAILGVAGGGWLAHTAFVLGAIATVLASLPLARVPFTARRFDRAMRGALGVDYLADVPSDRRARMRSAPVVLLDLFRGLDTGLETGTVGVVRGIAWAAPAGVPLTIDIYRLATGGPRPSVVQIYGGAWQRGAPADDARFAPIWRLGDSSCLRSTIVTRRAGSGRRRSTTYGRRSVGFASTELSTGQRRRGWRCLADRRARSSP